MSAPRKIQRVVVGVDFSDGSSTALARLRSVPLAAGARVHLVHVIAAPTLTPLAVAREIAEEQLGKVATLARRKFLRARVTSEVSSGRPADEIARIARHMDAELIVVGRRGAGGFPRLNLGSTAERLARLAPAPILIVAEESAAWKRALLALDVAEDVAPLVRAATRLLPGTAAVELLHVYWVYGEGYLRFGGARETVIEAHRTSVREQAAAAAAPVARSLERAGFRPKLSLMNGDPRRIVPRVLRVRRADVVIIGNHARTAISRALLGSVASEVLRNAKCDVCLVPVG